MISSELAAEPPITVSTLIVIVVSTRSSLAVIPSTKIGQQMP
jgi:hypothetical protein